MKDDVCTAVIGHAAEDVAIAYLVEKQGMRLLDRNIEACGAEVDLIMQDGEYWVFVEVRSRDHFDDVHPFETIDRKKQLKVIRVAKYYLVQHECFHTRAVRFDAIAVCLQTGEVEWVPNAFCV